MKVSEIKALYPTGTRVLLHRMGEDPRPIPDNTKGTVLCVDDIGTVHVRFDCGRVLGVMAEIDDFEVIEEKGGNRHVH